MIARPNSAASASKSAVWKRTSSKLREQLAGRDEEIRALRARVVGRVLQGGGGGAETHGAQTGNARGDRTPETGGRLHGS